MRAPEFLRDFGWRTYSQLTSRFVGAAGLRIHARSSAIADPQPAFVLIPGLVISSLYFVPLAEELAKQGSVHAIDLPGFGRSSGPRRSLTMSENAEVILKWADVLELKRLRLVANSMGCQIAAHVATMAPERVENIVMIGPTIDPRHHWLGIQILKLISDAFQEPPQLWLNWIFDFVRSGGVRPFGTTRWMFKDRIEQQLPRVLAPTLVLRGEYDTTVPERWARKAAGLLPRGHYAEIPGHAHCVHYTAPVEVARNIREFNEQSGRSRDSFSSAIV